MWNETSGKERDGEREHLAHGCFLKYVLQTDDYNAPIEQSVCSSTSLLRPISCTGLSWNPSFLGMGAGWTALYRILLI